MKKPNSVNLVILLCAVLIVAMSVGLGFALHDKLVTGGSDVSALSEMEQTIKKHFYFYDEEKGEEAIIDGALRGMMAALQDPYAQYYTEAEYNELLQEDAGDYMGLGINVITPDEIGGMIIEVYPGSSAELAGLQKGDIILSVNGTTTANLSMDAFLALFDTENGAAVALFVQRGQQTFAVSIKEAEVHVTRVSSELLPGDVGYIRISEFNGTVATDFWSAATSLRDQGVNEFVLDLRDNPGGGLTEVLGVANHLIPKGQVIATIKSKTEAAEVYKSEGDQRLDIDLIVLVNGGSASASELLTGALQDYGLAAVIGTQTYGKGIVQSYYRLRSNGGWMKLTTDAYYTPKDVCIHGVGITPDMVVELPEELKNTPVELLDHQQDVQLQAALQRFQSYANNSTDFSEK